MKLPADHKRNVIFPSEASSFNESFIREEKGAMRLPASLFATRGDEKFYILFSLIAFDYLNYKLLANCWQGLQEGLVRNIQKTVLPIILFVVLSNCLVKYKEHFGE